MCDSWAKSLSLPGERIGYIYVSDNMPDAADVAAAVGGAYVYTRRLRRQISSQTSRINSLETVISEQQGKLDQVNALNNTLRDKIDSDQEAIDAYKILTGLTPEEVTTPPSVMP